MEREKGRVEACCEQFEGCDRFANWEEFDAEALQGLVKFVELECARGLTFKAANDVDKLEDSERNIIFVSNENAPDLEDCTSENEAIMPE